MDDQFRSIVKEFNRYSNEKNLDIELNLIYFTDSNDTIGYVDYSKALSLFGKRNKKYDIYAYDFQYLNIFSPYLLELEEYLPKNLTDLYSSKNNKKLTTYNGHILGFPIMLMISVMYSNDNYLRKYNKSIPKTWDELIETTEYILNEEKKIGNNDLSGYAALFPNSENTLCAFYQLLYSYRDNVDDEIPDVTSKNAKEALEKMMEIKDKISSDELFRLPENQIVKQMYMEKTIFNHFYSCMIIPNYTISLLPGKKEGINASIVGGYNIGINKYISKDKLDASLEIIKYICSKQFHKDFIVKQLSYITPLEELYNDFEVCESINCEMLRNVQYYFRPQASMKFYNMFSSRAIDNIQKLIDGELTVDELLTNINDITRIYYLDMKSTLGIILISILVVVSCVVIVSTYFIFIPGLKSNFKFLSNDLWVIYSLGAVMMLISIFKYFNIPSKTKCLLLYQLIINGYTFIFVPIIKKVFFFFC